MTEKKAAPATERDPVQGHIRGGSRPLKGGIGLFVRSIVPKWRTRSQRTKSRMNKRDDKSKRRNGRGGGFIPNYKEDKRRDRRLAEVFNDLVLFVDKLGPCNTGRLTMAMIRQVFADISDPIQSNEIKR